MPAKRATIRDVAAALGMSTTTVSASLTGGGRVSNATRALVLQTAEEMGYRALPVARHLRGGSTSAIGLYLPSKYAGLRYHMRFAYGVAQRARERGVSTVLLAIDDGEEPLHRLAFPVDGIVVGDPLRHDPHLAELVDSGIPVVFGEGALSGMPTPSGTVRSDHRAALIELLGHVARGGATRPVMLSPTDDSYWGEELRAGYHEWCAENGYPHVTLPIAIDEDPLEAGSLVSDFLDETSPDAILSSGETGTAAVLTWVRRRDRQIGEDLLLAQCTETATTVMAHPQITSLDLRPDALGAATAGLLLDLLDGTAQPGTVMEHHVAVLPRESTAMLGR